MSAWKTIDLEITNILPSLRIPIDHRPLVLEKGDICSNIIVYI